MLKSPFLVWTLETPVKPVRCCVDSRVLQVKLLSWFLTVLQLDVLDKILVFTAGNVRIQIIDSKQESNRQPLKATPGLNSDHTSLGLCFPPQSQAARIPPCFLFSRSSQGPRRSYHEILSPKTTCALQLVLHVRGQPRRGSGSVPTVSPVFGGARSIESQRKTASQENDRLRGVANESEQDTRALRMEKGCWS